MLGLIGLVGEVDVSTNRYRKLVVNRLNRIAISLVLICIIAALSIRTVVRNSDYYNRITLYSHDLRVQENSVLEK